MVKVFEELPIMDTLFIHFHIFIQFHPSIFKSFCLMEFLDLIRYLIFYEEA